MTESFDVCGPLPTGVTVLEASAGTGKTFTIAALAARYVAEGIPLEQIADGHLHAHGHGRAARAGPRAAGQRRAGRSSARWPARRRRTTRSWRCSPPAGRRWSACAASGWRTRSPTSTPRPSPPPTASARRCSAVSACSATSSPTRRFVEDISDLRDEVVDDLYLRRFHRRGVPEFSRGQAMAIATAAIENPAAPLEPAGAPADTIEAMRVRLAGVARDELEARKRRMGVMTYDDLLTRLSSTLAGEGGAVAGGASARALPRRARRRVPGHRPRAVADHADRVRRRRGDARADRRSEAGDLRVPRRRRLRLHRGRAERGLGGHADDELAQRPGPDRRLRRPLRRREARARGDHLPRGPRRGGERAARACTACPTRRRCGSGSSRATRSA